MAIQNKALDILCVSFDSAVKEIKKASLSAQKWISGLKETLLEENESKYNTLCDKILEIEEECGEPPRKKMKIQLILDELCFTSFGTDFCEWIFNELFIRIII